MSNPVQPMLPGVPPPSRLVLSHSRLQSFWTCQQKYVWSYIFDLAPRGVRQGHLDVGALTHEGVRNLLHPINRLQSPEAQRNLGIQGILTLGKEVSADESSILEAIRLFDAYLPLGRRFLENHDILAVEPWIEMPMWNIQGVEVVLLAKCDGLVRTTSSPSQIKLFELKTSGSSSAQKERMILEGPQVTQYLTILGEFLQAEVYSAYVHIIVKTKSPQVQTLEVLHHPQRSSMWKSVVQATSEVIVGIHQGNLLPLRNLDSCNTFLGECPFKPVCQHDIDSPSIRSLYDLRKDQTPRADARLLGPGVVK